MVKCISSSRYQTWNTPSRPCPVRLREVAGESSNLITMDEKDTEEHPRQFLYITCYDALGTLETCCTMQGYQFHNNWETHNHMMT